MSRILVVDDDELVRDVVANRLRKAGHEIVCSGDGEDGLALATESAFDLVLLDSMMPKLSGVEVCRRLRDDDRTKQVAIILLTARSQEADVARGFAAGADDYVAKPFSPKELESRVEAILATDHRARMTPLPEAAPLVTTFDALREEATALAIGSPALAEYLRVLLQVEVAANDARSRYGDELAALQRRLDGALTDLRRAASEAP